MLSHEFECTAPPSGNPLHVQPEHWNARHIFSGGSTGSLLARDEDSEDDDGKTWIAAAQGVLACAGAGQVPAFTTSPSLVGLTLAMAGSGNLVQTIADSDDLTRRLWKLDLSASGFGDFESVYASPIFPDDLTRPDRTWTLGYNVLGSAAAEPGFGWSIESYYAIGAERVLESYWQYNAIGGGTTIRPVMVQVNRATNLSTNSYQANGHFWKNNADQGQFYVDATGVVTQSGLAFVQGTNNVSAIKGMNATGTAFLNIAKVDASNIVQLGDAAGVQVPNQFRLNAGLTGVVTAAAGVVAASYSITADSIASENGVDLSLTGTGTGAIAIASGSIAGASVYINGTGGRGAGTLYRKSGSYTGYIGADGQYLGGSTANFMVGANTNLDFYSNFAGTPAMRLTTTGRLGIGTTSPSGGLHVVGAGGAYTPYLIQASKPGSGQEEAGVIIDGQGHLRLNTSITASGNPWLELPDFILNKNYMIGISSDLAAADPSFLILTTDANGGPHMECYNGTTAAGTRVFQIANNGDINMGSASRLGTNRIDIGATPATFGALRFSNGFAACVRNNGGSADRVLFGYSSNFTDALEVGDSAVNTVLMGARVGFGGLNSGVPALKASGAILQVRTGDDGNLGTIESATFRASGSNGVTAGPLTSITSITIKGGIVTAITGS